VQFESQQNQSVGQPPVTCNVQGCLLPNMTTEYFQLGIVSTQGIGIDRGVETAVVLAWCRATGQIVVLCWELSSGWTHSQCHCTAFVGTALCSMVMSSAQYATLRSIFDCFCPLS